MFAQMFVQNLENFVLNRLRKYVASIEFLVLKCKIFFTFYLKFHKFVPCLLKNYL